MKYFLKRCGFQELGSVGEDGKPKRGRYLMSSQHEDIVNFFPPLSIEIPNDTAVLPMVPLHTGKKTYCSYVYHNSKYTGSNAKHPRNEYRIYLNTEMEGHQLYFCSEDIVVMRKSLRPTLNDNGSDECFYYVDVVKNHYSDIYMSLSRIIESYPTQGGYGIYDGILDFFEDKVQAFEAGGTVSDIIIDETVTKRIKKSTEANQKNIFNAATFRDFVLAGYGNACAVSGEKINNVFDTGIDVVYIRPRADGGSCMPCNGIALSKNFSLAFVQGKFTLTANYEIEIHPDAEDIGLQEYRYKQIRVPPDVFFRPSHDSVRYHRENIYGKFLNNYKGKMM